MDKLSVKKMDRLSEQFAQIIDRHESCFSDEEMVIIFKVFRIFKQYENTELLPEEIEDICNRFAGFLTDMTNNRMSKLNYTLDAMIQCARDAQEDDCLNFCEYQIASMEDRLYVTPFDIGSKVYAIELNEVVPAIVCNYRIDETGLKVICQYEHIGKVWLTGVPLKTVFKTKVAAEQMFETMKNTADRTIVRKVIDGTSN